MAWVACWYAPGPPTSMRPPNPMSHLSVLWKTLRLGALPSSSLSNPFEFNLRLFYNFCRNCIQIQIHHAALLQQQRARDTIMVCCSSIPVFVVV